MKPLIIDYPLPVTMDGGLIVCVPTTVTLEIEPDESIGNTDYYIAAVHLEGHQMVKGKIEDGKPKDYRVPDTDPLSEMIRTYAYRTHKAQLEGRWQTYLNDLPSKRRAY
jgi:hypothetical protein